MDCQDLHKFVDAYLDGEFIEDERVSFAAHLQVCPECRQMARTRLCLKQRVRESALPAKAPSRLRDDICRAISRAEGRQRGVWRWTLRLAPVAVALLMVVGAMVSRRIDLSSLAEQSVRWHRTELPMDVRASSAEPIRRFLSEKVPFAVRLPRFRSPDAKLEGARLSSLGGHQAAYLRYRVRGQPVSVFIVDPRALPSWGGVVTSGNRAVQWRGVHGYNVALFASGGTGYAVASEMDRGRLVHLIAAGP